MSSIEINNQEQLSLRLIYSEIVGALHCQEIGGIFVCKIMTNQFNSAADKIIAVLTGLQTVSNSFKKDKASGSMFNMTIGLMQTYVALKAPIVKSIAPPPKPA